MPHAPASSLDLFDETVRANPHAYFEELRATGPAVFMEAQGIWALTHHHQIEAALRDADTFSSEGGVALTERANRDILSGTVLAADGETHTRLRRVLSKQLAPRAMQPLIQTVTERAHRLVDEALAEGGEFDAAQLATRMTGETVMEQMGLQPSMLDYLLDGASATFETFGPANERFHLALPIAGRMVQFLHEQVTRATVAPGSWMGAIFRAVDQGRLEEADAIPLCSAYTTASMDTTIYGLTEALTQLARHPEQWASLRRAPVRLATPAFHEALRLEAPLQGFGRRVTRPVQIGEAHLAPDEQIWLLYGSAGRDQRMWGPQADEFEIRRLRPDRHLAFGRGPHMCAGVALAELQAHALLGALVERCTHLALAETPVRANNNLLRGYDRAVLTAGTEGDDTPVPPAQGTVP